MGLCPAALVDHLTYGVAHLLSGGRLSVAVSHRDSMETTPPCTVAPIPRPSAMAPSAASVVSTASASSLPQTVSVGIDNSDDRPDVNTDDHEGRNNE